MATNRERIIGSFPRSCQTSNFSKVAMFPMPAFLWGRESAVPAGREKASSAVMPSKSLDAALVCVARATRAMFGYQDMQRISLAIVLFSVTALGFALLDLRSNAVRIKSLLSSWEAAERAASLFSDTDTLTPVCAVLYCAWLCRRARVVGRSRGTGAGSARVTTG